MSGVSKSHGSLRILGESAGRIYCAFILLILFLTPRVDSSW
ncbi:wingless-type MMTV integration site family, member 2Bb, partial [Tachysurus ichikawai]